MLKKITRIFVNPLFYFTFLILIFFFPILFQNQVFYYGDIFTSYFPYKNFLLRSLLSGVFPLWNPYILSGYPMFADISLGTYYLPNILIVLWPTMKMFSFVIIIHFFISLVSMYLLAKRLDLSKTAAVFSAITFSFSGLLINYIADTSRLFVVTLYPLFFFFLLTLFKKRNYLWFFATSVVLSFQIFAGHIQYVFLELVFLPFFILFNYSKKDLIFRILVSTGVIFLAVLFSSIILLPSLEIIPYTTRSEIFLSREIYQNFSLKPIAAVKFIIAHFWGIKKEGSAWGVMDTSLTGYIGFIPLVLIFLTIKKLLTKINSFLLITISFIALIISFGVYLPYFDFFIKIFPLFKIFRNPMSTLAIYTLAISLVSGYALDYLDLKNKTRNLLLLLFIFLGFISLFIYLVMLVDNSAPFKILIFLASLINKNLSLFHTVEVDFLIAKFITFNILLVSLLAFLAFFIKRKEVFIIVIFLDLLILTRSEFFTINNDYLANHQRNNSAASYLKQNLGSYRYLSTSDIAPYSGLGNYFGNLAFQPPFSKEGERLNRQVMDGNLVHEINLIPPDFSTYYGIPSVYGWATFILKDYNSIFQKTGQLNELYQEAGKYNPFIKEIKPDVSLTTIDLSRLSLNDEIFDKLAVKYVVTDREVYLLHHKLVFKNEGISIYENEKVMPRVVVVDEKNNIVENPLIISYNPNSTSIKVQNKGKLILWDTYYKGWKAYVNGQKTQLKPYENIFRSVDLQKEDTLVKFNFEPESFKIGSIISLFSLSLASLFLGIKFIWKK